MNPSPITKLPDGSGCFTATIYSAEEIAAMPVKKRPICARISSEMYHAVFEKVGTASMAWEPRPTGVFDTELASKVAVDLCFIIANEVERREREAFFKAASMVYDFSQGYEPHVVAILSKVHAMMKSEHEKLG